MQFVIEHLEPRLSDWLFMEYSSAAEIAGKDLLITNVQRASDYRRLSRITRVEKRSARELFRPEEIVVLDPRARRALSPEDLREKAAILIGGILGNDPPLGRTRELLVKKLPRAMVRHIGRHQFAIDGSVYVARQVSQGRRLEEIPVLVELEIPLAQGCSVILPYAFPLVKGRPLISRDLIEYLKRH